MVFGIFTIASQNPDVSPQILMSRFRSFLSIVRAFNAVFDLIYVLDACVYAVAWYSDSFVIKELRIERGQDVHEVDLGRSFELADLVTK